MPESPFRIGTDISRVPFQTCVLEREHATLEEASNVESKVLPDRHAQNRGGGRRDVGRRGRGIATLLEASVESEWVTRHLEWLGHGAIVAAPSHAPMSLDRSRRLAGCQTLRARTCSVLSRGSSRTMRAPGPSCSSSSSIPRLRWAMPCDAERRSPEPFQTDFVVENGSKRVARISGATSWPSSRMRSVSTSKIFCLSAAHRRAAQGVGGGALP